MSFDFATLITDRQKSDADYARALMGRITNGTATAEELAAWNAATLKGVYDYTDLNRVTAAMDEINTQLSAAGYKTGYIPIEIHKSKLPDGYTELEYIESTGEQYIDTWFKPNQDTRVIVDAQMLVISTAFYFGARTASATINYNVLLSGSAIRSDYGESKVSTSAETATNRLVINKSKSIGLSVTARRWFTTPDRTISPIRPLLRTAPIPANGLIWPIRWMCPMAST